MPTIISISNQKGGVGKTTLTSLVCSQLHYRYGIRCLAVDADPQLSLYSMRDREMKALSSRKQLQDLCNRFYSEADIGMYPVFRMDKYGSLVNLISSIITTGIDAILVDLPGSISQQNVLDTLLGIEYLYVPVVPDRVVIEATMTFHYLLKELQRSIPDRCQLKAVRYFMTQVDARVNIKTVMDSYRETFSEAGMVFLETVIPRSVRFSKESVDYDPVVRSTLLPMKPAIATELMIESLTKQIINTSELCQRQ